MKLYYMPGACSLSPHIVAREAGIGVDLVKVNGDKGEIEGGGSFRDVNPKGYVPALELDDGQVLTEGPAIVQYLADRKPASNLAPPNGALERYRLQEWLNFTSTELHKSFGPLFHGGDEKAKDAAREKIGERLGYVADQLAGRAFLLGPGFTVADAYMFVMLTWTAKVGIDLGTWPALKDYHARILARPAVQMAMKAEGLLK